jgi:cysteinyl-tRNA synthetase
MSKSLGNFFTLREIFEKFDPMVVRFYFLKHHYRNPLDFSFDDLQAAQSAYERIVKFFSDVVAPESLELSLVKNNEFVQPLVAALQDDLNTSELFGVLFSSMPRLQDDLVSKPLVKYFMIQVLGLRLTPIAHQQVVITSEIETLLEQREQARKEKNWALSDKIRDQLSELGYQVHDKKLK